MTSILDFFTKLIDPSGFMPRWKCGRWDNLQGWTYILSDINIGISYLAIPLMIFLFIRRRKDFPYTRVLALFCLFIVFCGLSHIADAVMFWFPIYRLNALILAITAIVSTATVVVLYKILPKALSLKSPAQLQVIIEEQTKELKNSNEKLRESEAQFKALVNHNKDIITLFGSDLTYKFVNDSLGFFSNTDLSFYIGKTPEEVLPEHPHTEMFVNTLKAVLIKKETITYEIESTTELKGQGYFKVEMIPLFNNEGGVESVLTITKDITSIRKNEIELTANIDRLHKLSKRLEYKRNVLQDFAYIVSHNLRSPTGNLISLRDLYSRTKDQESKEDLLLKLFSVAEQLSNTVQNLSEVVNINQSSEIHKDELSFEKVLQNLMISLSAEITSSQASITYDFSACESISYPKMYLESILLNLLTNAIKYSSPERKLSVSFITKKEDNGLIILECADNGMGLDLKKYGSKVFTLNKTFHHNSDARGIGLFITKHQIKSLGGSIAIESEPNKGAKFIIKFNEIETL